MIVITKTWYKKRNSALECYASPSYDVTSAGSDNSNNNWTTEEEYVDSRHRQNILPFSKTSRRLCDTHWTCYTIQRVPEQTDGFIFFRFADGLQSLKQKRLRCCSDVCHLTVTDAGRLCSHSDFRYCVISRGTWSDTVSSLWITLCLEQITWTYMTTV